MKIGSATLGALVIGLFFGLDAPQRAVGFPAPVWHSESTAQAAGPFGTPAAGWTDQAIPVRLADGAGQADRIDGSLPRRRARSTVRSDRHLSFRPQSSLPAGTDTLSTGGRLLGLGAAPANAPPKP